MQLVGRECVICQSPVTSAASAKFCGDCGNPVHQACLSDREPTPAAGGERCTRCGGSRAQAPQEVAPPPAPAWTNFLVPLIAMAAIALVVFLIWPLIMPPASPPVAAPEADGTLDTAVSATSPIVTIETSEGTIKAKLFHRRAPNTVRNFVELVEQEFYDGIIFHRVIADFMIQTGDPRGQGTGGRMDKGLPAKFLADEFHPELRHDRPGVLSMANSGPDTGDTQFFITAAPTPWLDDKHAIFGEVIEGMDVVRRIEQVPTKDQDRPVTEIKMTRVRLQPAAEPDGEVTTGAGP